MAIQAATADRPSAATSSGGTSNVIGTISDSATEQHSRRLPSPGPIPARVENHAMDPGGTDEELSTRPTPWTPGT